MATNKIKRAVELGYRLVNKKTDSIHLFVKGNSFILIKDNKPRHCITNEEYLKLAKSYMANY
jgi:hypothetical protein